MFEYFYLRLPAGSRAKLQAIFTMAVVVLSCSASSKVRAETAAEDFIRIPKDTRVPIIIQSEISSEPLHGGETFIATTKEDLVVDGKVVWPAGSVIKGDVIRNAIPPRMLDRSAEMRLTFNSIQPPAKGEQTLKACLVARGGVITFLRGEQKVQVDTLTQLSCGGLLVPGPQSSGPIAEAQSRYGVPVKDLFKSTILIIKKGRAVNIEKGDVTRLQIFDDMMVPKSQID